MINWIFRIFVFLLPTQLAFHLWPNWAFVFGIRVDYLSPAIYLTDILLFFLLAVSVISKKYRLILSRTQLFWFGAVLLFATTNIYFAFSPQVAFFKWLKVIEVLLLVLLLKKARNLSFERDFLPPLFVSAALFSLIGILQTVKGSTLGGGFYYLGERSFSLLTPGVSKFFAEGREYLSAYSTFSHPNSLAGYLSVVLLLFLTVKKKPFSKWLNTLVLMFIFSALVLTFSVAAFFGLLVSFFVYRVFKAGKPFFLNRLGKALVASSIFVSILFPLASKIDYKGLPESFTKRFDLGGAAYEAFSQSPFVGIGLNNFIPTLSHLKSFPNVSWFLQPVHNIYLLVLAEAGAVGLILFSSILFKGMKASLSTKNPEFFFSLSFIIIAGMFDHYFLTLQQNLLLFCIVLGYSLRND